MRVAVFYCWTFWQMVSMINIKFNFLKNTKSFLYIADEKEMRRYEGFLSKVKDTGEFEEIFQFDFSGVKNLHTGIERYKYRENIRKRRVMEDLSGADEIDYYCAGFWIDSMALIRQMEKISRKIKIRFVEEGTILALGNDKYATMSLYGRIFNGGLFYRRFEKLVEEYYLYFKRSRADMGRLKCVLIPPIEPGNPVHDLLASDKEPEISAYENSIVYFDMNDKEELANAIQTYERIFEICRRATGRSRVLFRRHPRSRGRAEEFSRLPFIELADDGFTTEELFVSGIDWNKTVICTIGSSVALNAKMVYGKEPFLILLYKLLKKEKMQGIEELFDKYEDKNKLLIPETMEELEAGLERWHEDVSFL